MGRTSRGDQAVRFGPSRVPCSHGARLDAGSEQSE